jgi:alanine racemase
MATVPTTPELEPIHSYPYRSWVEISLARIAENFRNIRALVGNNVEVMPVVKADAYRHGAVEVSKALQDEGAHWLAVSNTEEGIAHYAMQESARGFW